MVLEKLLLLQINVSFDRQIEYGMFGSVARRKTHLSKKVHKTASEQRLQDFWNNVK